jgi:hypothetical protein
MFRISYKQIFKKIISYTPDLSSIKENILLTNSKDERYEDFSKSSKVKEELKKVEKMKKDLKDELLKTKINSKEHSNLDLEDAPRKITIIKKEPTILSKLKDTFSAESSNKEEKTLKTFYEQKHDKWVLPSTDLLSDIS